MNWKSRCSSSGDQGLRKVKNRKPKHLSLQFKRPRLNFFVGYLFSDCCILVFCIIASTYLFEKQNIRLENLESGKISFVPPKISLFSSVMLLGCHGKGTIRIVDASSGLKICYVYILQLQNCGCNLIQLNLTWHGWS